MQVHPIGREVEVFLKPVETLWNLARGLAWTYVCFKAVEAFLLRLRPLALRRLAYPGIGRALAYYAI
jgi:hypothetical protein